MFGLFSPHTLVSCCRVKNSGANLSDAAAQGTPRAGQNGGRAPVPCRGARTSVSAAQPSCRKVHEEVSDLAAPPGRCARCPGRGRCARQQRAARAATCGRSAGRRGAARTRAGRRGRRRPPRLAWPVGAGPGAGGGGEGWDGALARGFSLPHPLLPSPPVPVRLQVPPRQLGGRRGMLPPPCPEPE